MEKSFESIFFPHTMQGMQAVLLVSKEMLGSSDIEEPLKCHHMITSLLLHNRLHVYYALSKTFLDFILYF